MEIKTQYPKKKRNTEYWEIISQMASVSNLDRI